MSEVVYPPLVLVEWVDATNIPTWEPLDERLPKSIITARWELKPPK